MSADNSCHVIFLGDSTVAVENLEVGDTGPFESLSAKGNPKSLVLVYMPALSALLARAEELKGKVLSDTEIQRIKNGAQVIAVPKEVADATIENRSGVE